MANNNTTTHSTITQLFNTITDNNPSTKYTQQTNTITNNNPTVQNTQKHLTKTNRPSLKDRKGNKLKHTPEQCYNSNCLACAELNIVNLSNTELTNTQKLLLNRGLSFAPTASNAESHKILRNLKIFAAKVKRQYRTLNDPLRLNKPDGEPIKINRHELGHAALENAVEAMRDEIVSAMEKPKQKQKGKNSTQRAHKQQLNNYQQSRQGF